MYKVLVYVQGIACPMHPQSGDYDHQNAAMAACADVLSRPCVTSVEIRKGMKQITIVKPDEGWDVGRAVL